MNADIDKKKIRILCVGGKMQGGDKALPADKARFQFLQQTQPAQNAKIQGVAESEINQADVLLLFMAGSGWDRLECLRLPDGIARQKPLVVILDHYDHEFALALLKWGVEEVVSSADCTSAMLQHTVLSAMTRFQRNHQTVTGHIETNKAYEQTALRTLDTLPFGIMFTDKEARVLFMNSAAKRTCTNGSGVFISKDERCCAMDPDENSALHRLVHKISHESDDGADENYTFRITGEDGDVLTMLLVSVGKQSAGHGVAIFLDSGGGFFNISEDTLRSVYGLTQSEAGLLLRMVQGETLAEISEARSVTLHTVRAQLKSVFAKTDTNRQASLIKKVLTGPAVLMQR